MRRAIVADSLSCLGWDRNQTEFGTRLLAATRQFRQTVNGMPFNDGADFGGVAIEDRGNRKTLIAEAPVLQERPAQVPSSDQQRFPRAIQSKRLPNRRDQFGNLVADARLPHASEATEILANLRDLLVAHPKRIGNLTAGNRGDAIAEPPFQTAQIETHPRCHDAG